MIKSRLEAKSLRIWLFCIVLFLSAALIASAAIGLITESAFYSLFPFLDFNLSISGSFMGSDLPVWLTDNFSFGCSLLCVILFISLLAHLIYVTVLNIYRMQRKHAANVLRKTGYSKEYFELIEKKRRHLSGTALSSRNDLCAAKAYCDGRRYSDAFSVLREIDLNHFDDRLAASYYTLYTYLFLLTGDLENAKATVSLGEEVLDRYPNMPEKRLTDALMLYAGKDYEGARKAFEGMLSIKPAEVRIWAGLYLGLVYLRLGMKEKARELVGTLGKYRKTPRQSEDMIKLLKKIETAYALEAEEKAEEAHAVE